MLLAPANGIELCYETFGSGPTIVLIMGIGAQMIHWDVAFCGSLAARGFRVVRFDNRDVGLSTRLTAAGRPPIGSLVAKAALGLSLSVPYTLPDMARDVVGLLDHLGEPTAHVVGVSMGGMIAQYMAIHSPQRLRSLTSIMSATGARSHLLGVRAAALRAFLRPRPTNEEEGAEFMVELYRVLASDALPFPEERTRARSREAVTRAWHPDGFPRQLAAVLASGDRTAALASVRVPTLVMHGEADPLVPVAAGRATAAAVPGARFELVPKMGHFLPPDCWGALIDGIATHVAQVEAATATRVAG